MQWLNWQCGIGSVAAREKVRTARALADLPLVREEFSAGRLSYSKVRALTRIATPENEADLVNIALHGTAAHMERLVAKYRLCERVEEARIARDQVEQRQINYCYDEYGNLRIDAKLPPEVGAMVVKALEAAETALVEEGEIETDVSAETSAPSYDEAADTRAKRRADALALLARSYLDNGPTPRAQSDRYLVTVHVDSTALAGRASQTDGACEVEEGQSLAAETARRLGCDCSVVGLVESPEGDVLSIGRRSRAIPPSLRRALKARDGGCRFPGCDRTRWTEGHHIRHWADGGETKLSNLVTLCHFHHKLVHESGYSVRALGGTECEFIDPDGGRVEAAGCFRGNTAGGRSLERFHGNAGLAIDAGTASCRWRGERMDYGLAVTGLLARRAVPRLRAPSEGAVP